MQWQLCSLLALLLLTSCNRLVEEQIRLGVPSYNVKVMPVDQAENWVNNYLNGDENMRVAMLQTLNAQFGENNAPSE